MSGGRRTIEIDVLTADALEARAAARGVSVAEIVRDLVASDDAAAMHSGDTADLDRQWAEIEAGAQTTPHPQVVRWLETWGTPAFTPWRVR